MHLTMRAMNEFHRAAVAGTTTNALSMRARSACSNHLPCRVVNTLHQIPHANPTLQGVSQTSVRDRPGRLAPNPLRSLHDQPELSFLICRGDGVSDHRAGKAALRAYRQMLQGHEAARFADTAFELVDRLEVRTLGGDQPEHHPLVFRHLLERLERSRTRIVVFEQEPLRPDAPEDGPRDPLVPATRKPAAALISSAQVKAEGDAGKIPHDGVVHLDAAFQVSLRAPALGFVEAARRRIKQQRIVGRVELDIGRADPHQLRDFLAQDVHHVGEKAFQGGIGGAGVLRGPKVRPQARARQRDLRGAGRARTQKHEILDRQITTALKLLHDPEPCGALNRHIADGRRISAPVAPQKRVQLPIAEAADGFGESALEGEPTLLAVGDHWQAHALLKPDGILHGPVFDGLEAGPRDPARGGVFPRRNEAGGAKQAADVVCVVSDHGARSKPRPLSLLWTANALETVSIFLAADLVGTVAKRLGVRQPAAANVFSFAAYGHWVRTAPRSFYDSSHGASVQHRQWDRKTRIRAWNSEVKQM